MIILDTNVLSELMRPEPAIAVVEWLSARPRASLYVTSLSYAEILFGLALMPDSKRRAALSEQAAGLFNKDFAGHVLSFDSGAAEVYAMLAAERQLAGNRIGPIDGMIAAIARAHGGSLATRDRDFSDCGITVLNPWLEP